LKVYTPSQVDEPEIDFSGGFGLEGLQSNLTFHLAAKVGTGGCLGVGACTALAKDF
jgi:hypothetical protein